MHFLATSSLFSLSIVLSYFPQIPQLVNFWSNNNVDSTDLKSTSLHCTFAFRTVKLSVKFWENLKLGNAKSIKIQHRPCGHLAWLVCYKKS